MRAAHVGGTPRAVSRHLVAGHVGADALVQLRHGLHGSFGSGAVRCSVGVAVVARRLRLQNDAVASGRLKKGNLVLLASVGAGFTVGAVLLRWGF